MRAEPRQPQPPIPESRASLIARAHVWVPTDIAAMDLRQGPQGPDAFPPEATVHCDYVDKTLEGGSLKFACRIGSIDEVKVKYGRDNGEVYGEVLSTRLLWALGFGADRMYPVRVHCRGCPGKFGGPIASDGSRLVDPAVIERKELAGETPGGDSRGWAWAELDQTDDQVGEAVRAQRDALKLLAVFIQHTDNKPAQQRLRCMDGSVDGGIDEPDEFPGGSCNRPFLMIQDLGLTFGRANLRNANAIGSVNLRAWSQTPIWKYPTGCVGNLHKSWTGTLKDPVISEEGRRFLVDRLTQISDAQLHDLFEVARVGLRPRSPESAGSENAAVSEWVEAFKQKRSEVAGRRCTETWSAIAPPLLKTAPIHWLQSHSSPSLTAMMSAVSLVGYTRVYMAVAVILAFAYRLRAGAILLLLLALHGVITDTMKLAVSGPRPAAVDANVRVLGLEQRLVDLRAVGSTWPPLRGDPDDAYGFPSGHVASSTTFLLGLALFFGWSWAWKGLIVWIPVMALSRLYLGRHFPGDVLGGVAVGIIVAAVGLRLYKLANPREPAQARRLAWRVVAIAGALAVTALMIGLPPVYDAGRFLGIAVGVLVLVIGNRFHDDEHAPIRLRVGRVALAAILFGASWWGVRLALTMSAGLHTPAGTLLAAALPAAILLVGPVYAARRIYRLP